MRLFRETPSTLSVSAPSAPLVRRRDAYSIERFPAVAGGVHLVGYDGHGGVMVEVRLPAHQYTEDTMEEMRAWMMRNDKTRPDLSVLL